jgi:hypothetical protein
MPMQTRHPSNKGKIPSDEIGSRGYDEVGGVEEEKSTGVERREMVSTELQTGRGILVDGLLAQVLVLKVLG